jgi:phosphatidylinositol kinase/protein kinase (PI-3  family)
VDSIVNIVEMMLPGASYPCLCNPKKAVEKLRGRFVLGMTDQECIDHVDYIVSQSANNWRTQKYDHYQTYSNGICS